MALAAAARRARAEREGLAPGATEGDRPAGPRAEKGHGRADRAPRLGSASAAHDVPAATGAGRLARHGPPDRQGDGKARSPPDRRGEPEDDRVPLGGPRLDHAT